MQQIRYVFYGGIKIENSLQTQTKPTIDEIPKHFEWRTKQLYHCIVGIQNEYILS